jgi:ATP-dependent RNA helicase HelY
VRIWSRPDILEKGFDLSFQREPDLGFAWAACRWASRHRLESVLIEEADLSAGDFVWWTKQLIDLLGRSPTRRSADRRRRARPGRG